MHAVRIVHVSHAAHMNNGVPSYFFLACNSATQAHALLIHLVQHGIVARDGAACPRYLSVRSPRGVFQHVEPRTRARPSAAARVIWRIRRRDRRRHCSWSDWRCRHRWVCRVQTERTPSTLFSGRGSHERGCWYSHSGRLWCRTVAGEGGE